jgi:hypothetical protein
VATPTVPSQTAGAVPVASALLDWDTATVTLPLDAYGMSAKQAQMVNAAAAVTGYLCDVGDATLEPALIEQAAAYLASTPPSVHWLWGRWDAAYVSTYGPMGQTNPPLSFTGGALAQDDPCREDITRANLDIVTTAGLYPPMGVSFSSAAISLSSATLDTYDAAFGDSAYRSLMAQWDSCITKAGYSVYAPGDGGAIQWADDWTDEQLLAANVTEAQCADSMNYTQKVGDIFAKYQNDYIAQHEAELIQIKNQANASVESAKKVLLQTGVL